MGVQELDDQALEVLQAAKSTEALLADKAESLAAIRAEFERKQKEVQLLLLPLPCFCRMLCFICCCSSSN